MSFYLQPLGKNVVVRQDPPKEKIGRGILQAAQSFTEAPCLGEVLAIGKDVSEVRVGDHVMWSKWLGVDGPVEPGSRPIIVMSDDQLVAVFDMKAYDAACEAVQKAEDEAAERLRAEREKVK